MPVITQINSQKFFSQYRNDEDWLTLPNDTSFWLLGSMGEKLRVETEVSVRWGTGNDGSPGDGIGVSSTDPNTFLRQAGSFLDDGFALGDQVVAHTNNVGINNADLVTEASNTVITYLDATTMTLSNPISNPQTTYSWVRIAGISDLEGCFFKYGLIENNESLNFQSKIDFNEQAYSSNGLVSAGVGVPLTLNEQDGNIVKSWHNGKVEVSFEGTNPANNIKDYKIVHEFYLLPYYVEGYLQNLQNQTLPLLFQNGQSLKYVFEADFRQTVNNPNEKKIITQSNVLGSTGWFNQNFNGFVNKFTISGLQRTEVSSGSTADGIIVDSKTRFNFEINNTSTDWLGTEFVIVGVSYLPDQADYAGSAASPNLNTVVENFLLDSKRAQAGGGAVSSTIVKDVTVTWPGAGPDADRLDVQVDFEYSAAQQALLDDSKNYVVWALVGSDVSTFTPDKSNQLDDRVALRRALGQRQVGS